MSELIENLRKMTVNGNRLELPSDVVFKNYNEIKSALTKAGGKYSKCGFLFTSDPSEIVNRLCGGEVIDDKKKYQYFSTPRDLAIDLVDFACIDEGMSVLEPSAGKGSIAVHIRKDAIITVVEINPANIKELELVASEVHCIDFLKFKGREFDRVVANPPFTKNQDIYHVMHMYSMLKSGGKLVSIMSRSWITGSQQKQVAFKKFINDVSAEVVDIESGAFKESGTNVATCMVIISKN